MAPNKNKTILKVSAIEIAKWLKSEGLFWVPSPKVVHNTMAVISAMLALPMLIKLSKAMAKYPNKNILINKMTINKLILSKIQILDLFYNFKTMKVQFQKNKESKNIISFLRADKSSTWTKGDDFLVLHDLSHYTIETTLHYTTAFYGIIKSGIAIQDFENKAIRDQMKLSNEAWYAETLANLLLIEYTQNPFENFNQVVKESLQKTNPDLPSLMIKETDLLKMRKLYKDLITEWKEVPDKKTMELIF